MKRLALSLFCLVLSALACRDVARVNGTALLVTVNTGNLTVDQLSYSGFDGDAGVFGPALRPETAAGPLASTSSVRVLLPDTLDQHSLEIRVEGLSGAALVGVGAARVGVVKGVERSEERRVGKECA